MCNGSAVVGPARKKASRDAFRKGQRARKRAIANAMKALWADEDADMANWLDEAESAYPGPTGAVGTLFGLASRAILELAEATNTEPAVILKRLLG